MYVCVPHTCPVPAEARDGITSPEVELQMIACRHVDCWESNPGSLQEWSVFLSTGPPLQPLHILLWTFICVGTHISTFWGGGLNNSPLHV